MVQLPMRPHDASFPHGIETVTSDKELLMRVSFSLKKKRGASKGGERRLRGGWVVYQLGIERTADTLDVS
jgi:hypothetical protein